MLLQRIVRLYTYTQSQPEAAQFNCNKSLKVPGELCGDQMTSSRAGQLWH